MTNNAKKYEGSLDVLTPSLELAQIMSQHPQIIEKDLLKKGDELLGIFVDENATTRRFDNIVEVRKDVLKQAIEDISKGILLLRNSTIGIVTRGNKAYPYVVPHGNNPEGNVVFSINWKDRVAFKKWRNSEGTEEIPQETINAAVYRLAVSLSEVLKE